MRKIFYALTILSGIGCASTRISAKDNSTGYLNENMPASWNYSTSVTASEPPEDTDWWLNFDDLLLDSLIDEGLKNNYNVSMAVKRINVANIQVRQAMSGYYPTVGLSGAYNYSRNAGAISGSSVPSSTSSHFSLGAEMNWEIDLFGKIASQVKDKKSLLKVSKADFDGAMLSIAANIATYYMNMRTFQEKIFVTKEHLASQAKVVEIAKARFAAGLVSKLDVTQAESVYYS
ncbi:TolC family protein, partial [Duncaniella muris]|uniref:TolC family protein n=1 Tax=Duncaniella muris TaxID=2094150 RepID=UPI0025B751E3